MKIAIGSDHRGYHLKEKLAAILRSKGHEVEDVGTDVTESVDYPDFAAIVGRKVSEQSADRGILICGTGIGMAITANKFPHVRAAPITDEVTAEISRRHNDLNVLCLPADMLSPRMVERMVEVWIETDFEGGRHSRRVDKITEIEKHTLQT
ncbi:ribose 5-phosphate isomerase B [Bythopirellula polymerisocia]|uniref:Putative sugar phosphate isomerase YwlF n=1 Tax=Bythopirellula polymerisocia TaxID=2528003 RepID=A0A5C6CS14_9BACT|nr:ribose 5-phosphate isomerase B [Bythopirellula polymerisocia]TWU25866.1 putative sugar phosphate isomerase YwlF [Bythopirellula polymerisocia]